MEDSLQHPSAYNDMKATCVWACNDFHICMECNLRYFEGEWLQRALDSLQVYLETFAALTRMSIAAGRNRWRLTPKMHYMRHTYLDIQRTHRNPAYYHCFTDEDFVGRVARSSATLHRTTAMHRVLERYLDMLLRRWRGTVLQDEGDAH